MNCQDSTPSKPRATGSTPVGRTKISLDRRVARIGRLLSAGRITQQHADRYACSWTGWRPSPEVR